MERPTPATFSPPCPNSQAPINVRLEDFNYKIAQLNSSIGQLTEKLQKLWPNKLSRGVAENYFAHLRELTSQRIGLVRQRLELQKEKLQRSRAYLTS